MVEHGSDRRSFKESLQILKFLIILIVFNLKFLQQASASENDVKLISDHDLESLKKVNFLVAIAQEATAQNESITQVQCASDMTVFLNAIQNDQIWALKLIDSFGNMPKSFMWGNVFWFSSPELCAEINDPYKISLSPDIPRVISPDIMSSSSPFPMHLQMIYFNFTSPLQIDLKQSYKPYIQVGVCVPESCRQDDITKLASSYFENKSFSLQRLYDINMTHVDSKLPKFTFSFLSNAGLILLILILFFLFVFTILAEIVHVLQRRRIEINKTAHGTGVVLGETFFMCFSLRQNIPKILKTTAPKDFMPVIAGLRTIVCLWVTMLHIYFHSMFARSNVQFLYAKLESLILQPILQSCFYVDVFFVISGFLLVHNFLSNAAHIERIRANSFFQNVKLYLKFCAHRHFRLMPIFILTMVLSEFFFGLIDMVSPYYMNEESDLYCRETWWYNLLYIHNALPLTRMCSSWGWYIACEMQFYIFFLVILFVYTKSERLGKTIFALSAMIFVAVSFYSYYTSGINFQIDVFSFTIDNVYMKPWTRITPYFSGVFMGWLFYQGKNLSFEFKRPTIVIYWMAAALIYFATIFMSYWKETPVWIVSVIMSFGKLLFGIFIGSLISACQLGYGGVFSDLMSSKLFLYLNKFTFSMYMIAPIVISVLFGLRPEPSQFNEFSAASDIIAIIIISHLCSVLATLFVELPFQRLSSRFILNRA